MSDTIVPAAIRYRRLARELQLQYAGGNEYCLTAEFLRVHSPSAAVQGHGPGQQVLQVGKRAVGIQAIEPSGNYAIRLIFDDGHDSGIYSWEYLDYLGRERDALWQAYLQALDHAGASRDAAAPAKPAGATNVVQICRPD